MTAPTLIAREAGINADWQHIGDTGGFLDFAQHCGSALLIDDLKREGLKELRRRNSRMILVQRDYYQGWEGKWRDCVHDGNVAYTPEFMFDVLTSGYDSSTEVWINFGNEPARGSGDTLKADIEFYCKVIQLFINAKIRVVVMNIQVVELTPVTLPLFNPIFDLCNRYPQYVAFGIHEYFTFILPLGIGKGDWTRLLKWGDYPRDPAKWDTDLVTNAVNAQIGRDVWITTEVHKKYPNVRFFKTEKGFDRINNLPQLGALDNANGNRMVRGLDTIIALLHRYFNDDGQMVAGDQIVWMTKVSACETGMFYNWSTQPEWLDYSCAPYGGFRGVLLDYNNKVRLGTATTQPIPTTPAEQPPIVVTTKRTPIQIAADMQKLVDELKVS